jgi:saccharopine dehydrogenase-like NADP-dependent oxidoreductase
LLTVLVLGGYGFFGARIAAALASDSGIRLLIGGRDGARAAAAAQQLGLGAARGFGVDAHRADFAGRLRALGVQLVIHTAGPFQGQAYDVPRAAISAGCHYVDLADGRRFVAGIAELDADARRHGVCVISGASSLPALSSAVVARYSPRFGDLASIRIGISSGARTPGLATVSGIFGYAGKPFTRLENGEWITAYGWLDSQRHGFPAPLGPRWLGACDVPDLEVLPQQHPSVRSVSFHAGFASDAGHFVVTALAQLVRTGFLRSAAPFASPLQKLSRVVEPAISDRGGMFVSLEGKDAAGAPLGLTWHLLAARNHGPNIPCGAAIALARKVARGERLPVGATPCVGVLSVEEYLESLAGLDVTEVAP